jgi:SAM-dependent methyltransferase
MIAPALNELHAAKEALTTQLEQHAAQIECQLFDFLRDQPASLLSAGLNARSARLRAEAGAALPVFKPPMHLPFEESLRRLEALNPPLYTVWRALFEHGSKSYVEERLGSCSHRDHTYAQLFGAYIEIYGHGRILDIGYGPYRLPTYLSTRNPAMVCGVEPLEMLETPVFEVLRGFNEFLPWGDEEFDTVVSGTSLDHVMSLEVSLQEVQRVLRPDGKYIVWLASIPGSAPFDEQAKNFEPVDNFHLFHFDRAWIEPFFERYFKIDDAMIISQPGFEHVFYCMTPRKLLSF